MIEVSLTKIMRQWFDTTEYRPHFMIDYVSNNCLIIRHIKTHRIIVVIAQNRYITAHFLHTPLHMREDDPQLFYKMDNALSQFMHTEAQ